MSGPAAERTEKATGRRRQKERDKGNIPKSQDFTSAIMITLGVFIIAMFSGHILSDIQVMLYNTFTELKPQNISTDDILTIILPFVRILAQILLPFLILLVIAAIISIRMQVGYVFSPSKVKFDLSKLAPSALWKNAQKLFNPLEPRTIVEFIKSILKLLIVAYCGYSVLNGRKDELFALMGLSINSSFAVITSILTQMVVKICFALLIIGFLDRKYQTYEFEKSIKMTKQEIKDEYKETEGDPKIKSKIRSMQMKMLRQRMMSKIPRADVVVTNPTHYAVALQYDRKESPAPKVVAKGVDFVAFKIKEIAMNNNVPIVENPPLARALYKLVPIDGIIPSEMFVAVAEVLAYVYNKDKAGGLK